MLHDPLRGREIFFLVLPEIAAKCILSKITISQHGDFEPQLQGNFLIYSLVAKFKRYFRQLIELSE